MGGREKAILVAVCLDGNRGHAEASLAELKELARTAGVEVIDSVLQMRREADPRYLIGRGKLEDLNLRSMQSMVDLIIFDTDLTPSQGRHIAEATSLKVLDRTQLILDIFAQRAQTRGGQAPGRAGPAELPVPAPWLGAAMTRSVRPGSPVRHRRARSG